MKRPCPALADPEGRQIDTAVKLLAKDVPQLYQRRLRDQVLEDLHVTERECRDEPETDLGVSLETGNRLYQLRKATTQAANELSEAPLDTAHAEICQNELLALGDEQEDAEELASGDGENKPARLQKPPRIPRLRTKKQFCRRFYIKG